MFLNKLLDKCLYMESTYSYPELSPIYHRATLASCIFSISSSTPPSVRCLRFSRLCVALHTTYNAGVAIIYLILHLLTFFFTEKCGFKGFETGKYGTPPSLGYWFRQLSVYAFSLMTMKLLVVALFALWPGIFKLGEWLLSFLGTSDAAQVIL